MDGSQKSLKQSLQFQLSVALSLVILSITLAASIFSFVSAFREANELQDDQLRQIAALFNQHNLPIAHVGTQATIPYSDPDSRVVVQLLPQATDAPSLDHNPLSLPTHLSDGIQTLSLNNESWRFFVRQLDSGSRIAIGQQTAVRDEIARDSALHTMMSSLILVPVLVMLVGMLIRRMFKPMRFLVMELDQRSEQDLSALNAQHLPSEILPFVVAINRLLARVDSAVALQRRFVADAAHELRTPLTALSLQVERLETAEMSVPAKALLAAVSAGLQRTQGLVSQLLSLARAQEPSTMTAAVSLSLQHILRRVVEDLMPLVDKKKIDLGVSGESDAQVMAVEMDLITLVKNLLDNAIRYTPDEGLIELSITTNESQVLLQIDDSGSGIPLEERERVFDPFYRVLGYEEMGSGLGLAIVQTIAMRMKAEVKLSDVHDRIHLSGLRVTVTFPKAITGAS